MSKRSKYSAEQKFQILMEHLEGSNTISKIASQYNINEDTFYTWRKKYDLYGIKGLESSNKCKRYSRETKEAAIHDYLSGNFSQREVIHKYGISSTQVLRLWVDKYISHGEITATTKGLKSMTKGRSTTLKERLEIVLYCLAHGKAYTQTAKAYQVSYQQVYQWVNKYENGGEDALKDQRGRKKTEEELTSEERNKIKMKMLEKENERLRAENEFLKKLQELERGRF